MSKKFILSRAIIFLMAYLGLTFSASAASALYRVKANYQPAGSSSRTDKYFTSSGTITRERGTHVSITLYRQTAMSGSSIYSYIVTGSNQQSAPSTADYKYFYSALDGDEADAQIYCHIDPNGESGYSNGSLFITVNSIAPQDPDLIVSHITVDSTTSPRDYYVGETVDIDLIVWNVGEGSADSSRVGYYIGTSSTDTSDRWDYDSTSSLDYNQGDDETENYTFSSSDVGRRYFVFKADYRDDVDEDDEDNNLNYFGPFDVLPAPNVAPTVSVSTPASDTSVIEGDMVTISWDGTDPDDNAYVAIWYDEDNTYNNGNDHFISGLLSEDGSIQWDTADVSPNTYYVYALIADGEDDSYSYASGRVTITPNSGSVSVSISPAEANDSGAQWSLTTGSDTAWKDSGQSVSASPGNYQVSYKSIEGWVTPDSQNVTVVAGAQTQASGVYEVGENASISTVKLMNLTVGNSGQIKVEVDAIESGNYYLKVFNANLLVPEWEFVSLSSSLRALQGGTTGNTFTFYVTPDTAGTALHFKLYKQTLIPGIFYIVDSGTWECVIDEISGEVGSAVFRDGVFYEYAWHAGILWLYDGYQDKYRVLQASGGDSPVGMVDYEGSNPDFLGGWIYQGAKDHVELYTLNAIQQISAREEIIYWAKWQIGAEYTGVKDYGSTWPFNYANSTYQSGDGRFRCDQLVEYVYATTFGSELNLGVPEYPREVFLGDNAVDVQIVRPSVEEITHTSENDSNITVLFSELMSRGSFEKVNSIELRGSLSGTHGFNIVYSEKDLFGRNDLFVDENGIRHDCIGITIDPVSNFEYGEDVTVTLSADVRDLAGNNIQADSYVYTFKVDSVPTDIELSNSSISENQASGTVIGNLSSTDEDIADTFSYTLVSGSGSTDNSLFSISSDSLVSVASFDFESRSSYSIRVRTTDQSGLSYDEAFMITVQNVNETPMDIGLSSLSIVENQPSGTTIGTLSTTDPDLGNTFTYSLVAGTGSEGNASFVVNGNSLRSASSYDYEAKSSYSIRVQSSDQGGLHKQKTFIINIDDLDDQPVCQKPELNGNHITLKWSSFYSQEYSILWSTNLVEGFSPLVENIVATPPLNERAIDTSGKRTMFLKIKVEE